jgi:hypothetical protein
MDMDAIPTILHRIAEQKSSLELFLAGGGAKSYEDYCRTVGEYSALNKIESDIKEIERMFIEN